MSDERSDEDARVEKPLLDENVKKNVRSRNTWLRFFYIVVFALIMGLAEFVLVVVVVIQFFTVLLSGEKNSKLLAFAGDLSLYVYDIWRYVSFVSDVQPFPFGEWRTASEDAGQAGDQDLV